MPRVGCQTAEEGDERPSNQSEQARDKAIDYRWQSKVKSRAHFIQNTNRANKPCKNEVVSYPDPSAGWPGYETRAEAIDYRWYHNA
jgi:hypothetical protein